MNIAVIFAGGTGQRMNITSIPKQFLELYGKPIIVYTIEHFQKSSLIDGIIVVCIKDWIPYCLELVKKYNLNKVKRIVPGGRTGQESIYNGLKETLNQYSPESIVLIHDGVRPIINEKIIADNINCVIHNGSAITISPAIETIILKQKNGYVGRIFDRSIVEVAKAPQCFFLKDIILNHEKAIRENKLNFVDSASLMQYYGTKLSTVLGSTENIKITTPIDFYVFKAIIDAKENMQIIGL